MSDDVAPLCHGARGISSDVRGRCSCWGGCWLAENLSKLQVLRGSLADCLHLQVCIFAASRNETLQENENTLWECEITFWGYCPVIKCKLEVSHNTKSSLFPASEVIEQSKDLHPIIEMLALIRPLYCLIFVAPSMSNASVVWVIFFFFLNAVMYSGLIISHVIKQ